MGVRPSPKLRAPRIMGETHIEYLLWARGKDGLVFAQVALERLDMAVQGLVVVLAVRLQLVRVARKGREELG